LEDQAENEKDIQVQLKVCNYQIEELESCAKQASTELGKECEVLISVLIANREALKRGLLKVTDEGELCSSCPAS
jgi:hypothetical protein